MSEYSFYRLSSTRFAKKSIKMVRMQFPLSIKFDAKAAYCDHISNLLQPVVT